MASEEGSAIEPSNGTTEDALTSLVAATVSPDTAPVDPDHIPTGITPPVPILAPLATDPPHNANMNPQVALIMEQELKEAKDTIKQMGTALEQFQLKVVQLEYQAATGINFSMFPNFLSLV
jgi:hypothetical protein